MFNLNMNDLENTISSMQEKAKKLDEENTNKIFTAKSGGGMIEVKINGKGDLVDITIDKSLMEDKESLQILLLAGINDAIEMVRQNQKQSALEMISQFSPFKK
jgi:DNA-binding YbaB/EbfC family protein